MKISISILAGVLFILFSLPGQAVADEPRLFVTVTGASVQDRAMPLVLANQALDQGAEVRVLLCGAGGHLALSGYEAETFAPRDITPVDLLNRLMANGAKVEVCAIFLPNSDHDASDLREGIGVANPADVAAWMMAPDTRLFSH
ncbi:MAG: hypothetical protein EA370_09515 [Wenzhouxiangella sp.]|nr:MAG: hypothetical protein EA370_09515 [Wenzhouxiangella sp.]